VSSSSDPDTLTSAGPAAVAAPRAGRPGHGSEAVLLRHPVRIVDGRVE
jgi:hypothetical protein